MPSPIQLKRAGATTPVAMPPAGPNGELSFARGGFTDLPVHVFASNDLIISDGASQQVIVGASRQLELVGAQTITGTKTIGLTALSIPGGVAGDTIVTDGNGLLTWGAPSSGGIIAVETDNVTISGDGIAGDPVSLITGIFTSTANSGLAYAPGAVTVTIATQAVFGGSFIATDVQIVAGTGDASIITPRGLRTQLGADAATLITTAKTVVPAINELQTTVTAMSGVMKLAGAYDAATDNVTPGSGGEIPAGVLPAAGAGNTGLYLIVNVAGTGTGNAPAVPMNPGDWLSSNGTAWVHLAIAQGAVTADQVALVPPVGAWDDVQEAITALAGATMTITTDASLTGDGSAGNPLALAMVDGGTF